LRHGGKNNAAKAKATSTKPNILVIWGDDIGITNLSCYSNGVMGYRTPNIDRIAKEGMMFTDSYGEQSCTAGRSSFITGQSVYRTGLSKVGVPASPIGMPEQAVTIAALMKNQGYATGQFGKNHLGDLNKHLPTNHGFDEFFGNLYHLNAEEEPEMYDYFPEKEFAAFRKSVGHRGVIHSWATDKDDPTEQERWGRVGKQRIEDTGPLTRSGWRPATTTSPQPRRTLSSGKMMTGSRSSSGSTLPTCTYSPTPNRRVWDKRAVGSRLITTP
jgi:arylsulfatase